MRRAFTVSASWISRISRIWVWRWGSSTGNAISTRRSRLRGIQSAEASKSGDDADPRREPGHRGAQATHAAHDQVDPYARRARALQLLDQATVDESVHLRDDPRGPPGVRSVASSAAAQPRGR